MIMMNYCSTVWLRYQLNDRALRCIFQEKTSDSVYLLKKSKKTTLCNFVIANFKKLLYRFAPSYFKEPMK